MPPRCVYSPLPQSEWRQRLSSVLTTDHCQTQKQLVSISLGLEDSLEKYANDLDDDIDADSLGRFLLSFSRCGLMNIAGMTGSIIFPSHFKSLGERLHAFLTHTAAFDRDFPQDLPDAPEDLPGVTLALGKVAFGLAINANTFEVVVDDAALPPLMRKFSNEVAANVMGVVNGLDIWSVMGYIEERTNEDFRNGLDDLISLNTMEHWSRVLPLARDVVFTRNRFESGGYHLTLFWAIMTRFDNFLSLLEESLDPQFVRYACSLAISMADLTQPASLDHVSHHLTHGIDVLRPSFAARRRSLLVRVSRLLVSVFRKFSEVQNRDDALVCEFGCTVVVFGTKFGLEFEEGVAELINSSIAAAYSQSKMWLPPVCQCHLRTLLATAKYVTSGSYSTADDVDQFFRSKFSTYAGLMNLQENCAVCSMSGLCVELKLCAQCKGVFYCSRSCQKKDWNRHKRNCKNDD